GATRATHPRRAHHHARAAPRAFQRPVPPPGHRRRRLPQPRRTPLASPALRGVLTRIDADERGSFLVRGSPSRLAGGSPALGAVRFLAAVGAWREAPPRHEGGGAGRRSRQAPSLAANAGPLRASCPPLRTSPLMTRRRTGCR